jgi:alkaline phosphatase D
MDDTKREDEESTQVETTLTRREVLVGGVAAALTIAAAGCTTEPSAPGVDAASAGDGGVDAFARDGGSDDAAIALDAGPPPEAPETVPESPEFTMGVASGDVTSGAAVLWTSYGGTSPLELVVWEMDGDTYARIAHTSVPVGVASFVHVDVEALAPGTSYRFAFFESTAGARTARSLIGRFVTAPPDDALLPITFGAVSCVSNTRDIDTLGHAGGREDLSFFAFLGDSTYNDGAVSVGEYRAEWSSNMARPEYLALRAATSALATWDDHEFDNDMNPETFDAAQLAVAKQTFFEHQPLRRDATSPDRVWKRMRWGATLEVFVLDCRTERLPSTRSTPAAQYVSRAQMDWLKAGLVDSTAVFKVILNSVPITDCPGLFDLQPQDRWEGYAAQRTEILQHIDDSAVTGVLWVAGDFHLASAGRITTSGPGSTQIEVLVGPGAQSGNPLAFKMRAPQFDFGSTTNNYAVISLDPTTVTATIQWVDGAGSAFETQSYVLG